MIRYGAGLIVRAFVEIAVVLFVFAGLIALVAYRTARLFATTEPDRLDRLAGGIAATLGLAAGRSARSGRLPYDDEPELDDPLVEQADALLDWREQAL